MGIKVAINGFGRVGRYLVRACVGYDDIDIVAQAGDGAEAIELAQAQRPDVILMDIQMPHVNGVEATKTIRSILPATQIIILTTFDDDELVLEAVRAGARGYLLKDMEPEDVTDAILRAVRGETVVAPAMTMKLVDLLQPGRQSRTKENLLGQLTEREREILDHLAQGMSNKAIARALDISYDTVKLHVRHILSKLNFTSRVEAAVFAVEQRSGPQGASEPRKT